MHYTPQVHNGNKKRTNNNILYNELRYWRRKMNLLLFAPIYTPISIEINSPTCALHNTNSGFFKASQLLYIKVIKEKCHTVSSLTEISSFNNFAAIQVFHWNHLKINRCQHYIYTISLLLLYLLTHLNFSHKLTSRYN